MDYKDLRALAVKIPEPRDYFRGTLSPELLVPTNILLFHRQIGGIGGPARAYHQRHVLIFCLSCSADVIVDDLFVRLNPGQALLVLPYQFHGYRVASPDAKLVWAFVTFELERGTIPEILRQRPVALSSAAAEHLRDLIAHWLQKERPERNAQVTLHTAWLLHHLIQSAESHAHQPVRQTGLNRTLSRVCKLFQSRMHEGVRIKNISSEESISESHLRLLFRKRTGTSLGRYLHSMRMIRATQLLAQSDLSIKEISERCGYGSIYAFSRAFKTEMKLSPRAFRKKG
jgi:AraC-like DNA-binding protein